MSGVRVWAPRAGRVALARGARREPMRDAGNGWWQAEVALAHGEDYAFVIDGEGPFPDPRSPWQPDGVHGASRWVDHARFAWHHRDWRAPPLASAVIYELHVGTFTAAGDFDAAIARLEHLRALGVTHIELMPVAELAGTRGWGYDGVDLYAPHHAYGGPGALKRLVDACHARGLAVLLDVVYNHAGPEGNYLGRFGPYFTSRYRTPWGDAVNLDGPDSDEVRAFFVDNALMWLRDYHIDGLRIDAAHAMVDLSARHFLEQLAAAVRRLEAQEGRPLVVIAESDLNDPRPVAPVASGGYGLDALWNEDFHHALQALLTGERAGYYADFGTMAELAAVLTHGFSLAGRYSAFRKRRHGRPADAVPPRCFVACLQNHDQVGNRARGERIGHLIPAGCLKIGAALVLTAPFVPMLFQGEEWNAGTPFLYFSDHRDRALAEAVRQGRRRELAAFGWDPAGAPDPQAEASLRDSRLDWDEREREPHAGMLAWYRRLIALRRSEPALAAGTACAVRYDESARWLIVERGPVSVVCNFAAVPQTVALDRGTAPELLLASAEPESLAERIALAPRSVAIVRSRAPVEGEPR